MNAGVGRRFLPRRASRVGSRPAHALAGVNKESEFPRRRFSGRAGLPHPPGRWSLMLSCTGFTTAGGSAARGGATRRVLRFRDALARARDSRSTRTSSRQAPFPSMLNETVASSSTRTGEPAAPSVSEILGPTSRVLRDPGGFEIPAPELCIQRAHERLSVDASGALRLEDARTHALRAGAAAALASPRGARSRGRAYRDALARISGADAWGIGRPDLA